MENHGMTTTQLWDVKRVLDRLDMSRGCFDKLRKEGHGPAAIRFGNKLRFEEAEIASWIAGRKEVK
jgi:predicted DNA-binding transcriptional regulator AlpA